MSTQRYTVKKTHIPELPLLHSGKVRDIYTIGANHLLMIATDRLSAFDNVTESPIPEKGAVLTRVANFWFNFFRDLVPNHLSTMVVSDVLFDDTMVKELGDRAIVVKRLRPLPVEAIVRGYLFGSVIKEYKDKGTVCGISVQGGLRLAEKLPEVLFTPSTKAVVGEHDENISFDTLVDLIGVKRALRIRDLSITMYTKAAVYALERGIIIADTKFEFGEDENGVIHLIDEVLTPDSSRFWSVDEYAIGVSPPSFDKQFVRDYLNEHGLENTKGVVLPDDIVEKTRDKYFKAEELLTK